MSGWQSPLGISLGGTYRCEASLEVCRSKAQHLAYIRHVVRDDHSHSQQTNLVVPLELVGPSFQLVHDLVARAERESNAGREKRSSATRLIQETLCYEESCVIVRTSKRVTKTRDEC